jgi:hypothetical protein
MSPSLRRWSVRVGTGPRIDDEISNFEPRSAQRKGDFIGLLAVAFAATDVVTELLATLLPRMGTRWRDLATSFSWLVFDFGAWLTLLALLLALIAIARRGHDRRLGFVAVILVAIALAIIFIP